MAKIKIKKKLLVETLIEDREIILRPPVTLGPSKLSTPCDRAIWYTFRWASISKADPRQLRLMQRGSREESVVYTDLMAVGIEIITTQEKTVAIDGFSTGYSDGRIRKVPGFDPSEEMLLEIKTSNKRHFENLKDNLKQWKQAYYDQVQFYLHKFRLDRCLFIVVCKDDDRRKYLIIDYNRQDADGVLSRLEHIIYSPLPPMKYGDDPSTWPCIFCDHQGICFYSDPLNVSCRTCSRISLEGGKWKCQRKGKSLNTKKQAKACKKYRPLKD